MHGQVHRELWVRMHRPTPASVSPHATRLQAAWQLLQGAASWQAAEAALYLFSTVSLAVKTRVLAEANGGDENAVAGSAAAAAAEDRAQAHALLVALFQRICSPEGAASMLGAHPMLAGAACRLVEHYAAWFGRAGEEPPLQGGLQLLLRALAIPQVGVGWVLQPVAPLLHKLWGAVAAASRPVCSASRSWPHKRALPARHLRRAPTSPPPSARPAGQPHRGAGLPAALPALRRQDPRCRRLWLADGCGAQRPAAGGCSTAHR